MEKNFQHWHDHKSMLHHEGEPPLFKQREIWWCSIGLNVGYESDGKSQYYTRPVLIIRKFNRRTFLGVPLTTQMKDHPFYHRIHLQGREQCVMLSQLRMWDGKRLRSRLGSLPKDQFQEIRETIRGMV